MVNRVYLEHGGPDHTANPNSTDQDQLCPNQKSEYSKTIQERETWHI